MCLVHVLSVHQASPAKATASETVDREDIGEIIHASRHNFTDEAMQLGEEMEGEKMPSSRATKDRIRVKRKVVTKSYKEEPLQVRESEKALGRNSISWKDLEERKECRSQMRKQEKGQEPRCCPSGPVCCCR